MIPYTNLNAVRHNADQQSCFYLFAGPIIRSQVTDVEVRLHDFTVTSQTLVSVIAACASTSVQQALEDASSILMEPVMDLQVVAQAIVISMMINLGDLLLNQVLSNNLHWWFCLTGKFLVHKSFCGASLQTFFNLFQIETDETRLGSVLADLSKRRSDIMEIQADGPMRTVHGRTPLSELVGYSTHLRTMTSGTSTFTMELSQYRVMSEAEQRQTIEKITGFGGY